MKSNQRRPAASKCPTGILGFDEITSGGLPRGRKRMRELLGADVVTKRK